MTYTVLSTYKYVTVENPEALRDTLKAKCQELKILGRILLGTEGINAAVCGSSQAIESFKTFLKKDTRFSDLTFREQEESFQTYHKLVVRVRQEIVALGKDADPKDCGKHLPPETLKQWYDTQKDFVIIDARNDYEWEIGTFKGAKTLPVKTFREFADKSVEALKGNEDKEVVMFCTGGIRCEKSSAYLKSQGFKKVYQLQGGIINYINKFPNTHYEGSCFVFDDRTVTEKCSDVAISNCVHCNEKSQKMTNCFNIDCDKLFVVCDPCKEKFKNCCSAECMNAPNQRKNIANQEVQVAKETIGTVENYYPKAKVALLKLEKPLSKGETINFAGKTTKEFTQVISELRDYDGNIIESAAQGDLVTILVAEKVRKNDRALVV